MPVQGQKLVVDPSHPSAALFNRRQEPAESLDFEIVNAWWSRRRQGTVALMRETDGSTTWAVLTDRDRLKMSLDTLAMASVWSEEAEETAMESLRRHLDPHRFRCYRMTGQFLETSRRSGVSYLFRRLRPTLALVERDGELRVLAALCLHPLAYYEDTWGGAMVPTDDVLAHLLLMRGDERLYWRRANQHAWGRPEAG